jgi:hypothetical protein
MESDMQTTGIAGLRFIQNLSLLRSANEQPKLAGELITKTIESLQKQTARTPASVSDIASSPAKGRIVDITA